jgi:hypothetical protein
MEIDIPYKRKIIIKYDPIYKGNLNYMNEYFYLVHAITFNFMSPFLFPHGKTFYERSIFLDYHGITFNP